MATSGNGNRDVTLNIGAKTSGEDQIRGLAAEVQRLAKTGGEAAPQFEKLAAEIDRLADEAGALDTFKQAAADVDALAAKQSEAAAKAATLSAALDEQRKTLAGLKAAQADASKAFKDQSEALTGARYALEALNIEYPKGERDAASYKQRVKELATDVLNAKTALAAKRSELSESNAAASKAESAESKLATAYGRAAKAAETSARALQEQRDVMAQAGAAAEQLGVATGKLADEEQRIQATQQRAAQSRDALVASSRAAAAAAAEEAAALAAMVREVKSGQQALDELAAAEREAAAEAKRLADATEAAQRAAVEADLAFSRTVNTLREKARAEAAAAAAAQQAAAAAAQQAAVEADLAFARSTNALRQNDLADAQQRAAVAADAQFASTVKLLKAENDLQREAAEADLAFGRRVKSLRDQALAADAAAAAADKLKVATQGVSDELKGAFGAAGLRSLQAIQAEADQVRDAVSLMGREFRAGAISAQDLARAVAGAEVRLAQLHQEAKNMPALPGEFEKLSASIGGLINRFGALGAALATVGVVATPVLNTVIALERMTRTLTTVTGSSTEAARQIEFLRNVSQRAGQSFDVMGDSFAKFAASALTAGVPMKTVQSVFENTAVAAGNLGLSTDQVERALGALGQMAGKGTVQMEELRGQLGDALPGALSLLAKGLGLSDQQLIKLVESGQLLATDALPALSQALLTLGPKGGEGVSGLVAEFNRLKGVLSETVAVISSGAIGQALGVVFKGVAETIKGVAFSLSAVSEGVTLMGKAIGTVAAAVVNRDFENLRASLDELGAESAARLGGLADRITGVGTAANSASPAVGSLAQQVNATASAIAEQNPALEGNAASWVQVQARSAEAIATGEKAAVTAGKVAEAKKAETDAVARVVALSGDEVAAREATAAAATEYAKALDAQAAADQALADLATKKLADLEAVAASTGRADEATRKQLETLKQTAEAKQADADKTRALADAQRVGALAAQQQADGLRDNAGRLAEYRAVVQSTSAELISVSRRFAEGRATADDLKRATEALSGAKGRLRDAITDTSKALEFSISMMRAEGQIKEAGLRADLAKAKAMEQLALLNGDEAAASRARVAQREIEINIQKLSVSLSEQEATARLNAAKAELAEAQALGGLLPEKERELQLRIKLAEASLAEAKAKGEETKALTAELDVLKKRNAAASGGGGGGGGGGNASNAASTPSSAGSNRPAGGGANGINAQGVDAGKYGRPGGRQYNDKGQEVGAITGTYELNAQFDLWGKLQNGTLRAEDLAAAQNALRVSQENARLGSAGNVSLEGRQDDQAWIGRMQQVVARAGDLKARQDGRVTDDPRADYQRALSEARNQGKGLKPGGGSSGTAPTGGSYTVNVNLGGSTRSVNVASPADADALAALLRELQNGQGRVGG